MQQTSRRCSNSKSESDSSETRKLPAYQLEKARRLHRRFRSAEAGAQRGKPVTKSLRRFAWYWKDRSFRTDPKRKFQFSLATLLRLYRQWQRGGCVVSALYPRYRPAGANIPAPVVCRFMEFCASRLLSSLRDAWNEFSSCPGSFARRRDWRKQTGRFSYGQVQRYFSGADFHTLQTQLTAIGNAQAELARLRAQFTADIRRRLPNRPQRKRRTGMNLSFLSAQL
jgi:hypothetical protein